MQWSKRGSARLLFAAFSVVAIAAAFLRGDYLLGFGHAVIYAMIAASLLALFARSFTLTEKPSILRAIVIGVLSAAAGFAMAFPALINPDVQVFIDDQATDRAARAELGKVFASDPAFNDLSVSTSHLKGVNVRIHGSLNDRSDLDRLRNRIFNECPAMSECLVSWRITLRKPAERIDGWVFGARERPGHH